MVKRSFTAIALIIVISSLAACAGPTIPSTTSPPPEQTPPAANTTQPVETPPVTIPPATNVTAPPVTIPPATNATAPPVTMPPVTTPPKNIPVPGPNDVWLQGFTFEPQNLTVAVGTTVTWTNKDLDVHEVSSNDNLFYGSLTVGGSYSYSFDVPGSFGYYCGYHPGMEGKVIVR